MPVKYFFEKKQVLKFEFCDAGSGTVIDVFETTLGKIMGAKNQIVQGQLTNGGEISIWAEVQNEIVAEPINPGFKDYLRSGWQIQMFFAIDYTGSNGDPKQQSSLHYIGDHNQYMNAITQVGEIIEPYDYDRKFPVFGFGGIPHHMGKNDVSHCFPLTGDMQNFEANGIAGVLQLYKDMQKKIQLSGPTLFQHILQGFMQVVKSQ